MKNIVTIIFVAMLSVSGIPINTKAQCDSDEKIKTCIPSLPSGFLFLKGYEIIQTSETIEVEYSYVLVKDTQYIMKICTEGNDPEGIVITLYDYKSRKMVSSKIDEQYVSTIIFNCKISGIYYVTHSFEKSTNYCGASLLGLSR